MDNENVDGHNNNDNNNSNNYHFIIISIFITIQLLSIIIHYLLPTAQSWLQYIFKWVSQLSLLEVLFKDGQKLPTAPKSFVAIVCKLWNELDSPMDTFESKWKFARALDSVDWKSVRFLNTSFPSQLIFW